MLRAVNRPVLVVLLVLSVMTLSVTPALAGSAGGSGGAEACGVTGSPNCLPRGECLFAGGTLLIGTGSQKFNLKFENPPKNLLEKCNVDGAVRIEDEIPMDADDTAYAT